MAETSVLEFLIRAQNQANQVFDQARRGVGGPADGAKNLTRGFTDLMSAGSAVNQVIDLGRQVMGETIGKTMDYAREVRELSILTGASAEESSKLIQAKAATDELNKLNEAGEKYNVFKGTSRGMLSERAGYGNYYSGTYNAGEPGRASGGPMWAGVTRWVGENGPEPFTPKTDGWMGTPPAGGGGRSVQINLSFPSMFPPASPEQAANVLRPAIEAVVRELRRNGQV